MAGSIEDIRSAIARFHDDTAAVVNQGGLRPLEGSQAYEEWSSREAGDELLGTAFTQAHLLLESAADHMASVERLIHNPIQTIAPWTCARGCIESAAFGCWLLDPTVGVNVRIARSLAFRFKGIDERLKTERLLGNTEAAAYSHERIEYLESLAIDLGFKPILDSNGSRKGVGVRMPSATHCIRDQLGMELEFRLFSSLAHSHPAAISTFGFRATDPAAPLMLEKDLSGPAAALLLSRSAQAVHAIVRRRALLFGHPLDMLDEAVEAVCETLLEPLESGMRSPLPR